MDRYVDKTEQTTLDKIGERLTKNDSYPRESATIVEEAIKNIVDEESKRKNMNNSEKDKLYEECRTSYRKTYDEFCNSIVINEAMRETDMEELRD